MNRTIARRIALLTAASAALVLGACSGSPPEEIIETNVVDPGVNETVVNLVEPTPEPSVTPVPAPRGADSATPRRRWTTPTPPA